MDQGPAMGPGRGVDQSGLVSAAPSRVDSNSCSRTPWGITATLAMKLGSGLSATAVGMHLMSTSSTSSSSSSSWASALDVSLLLRLDLLFAPAYLSSSVAASSASVMSSSLSLGLADLFTGRFHVAMLLLFCVASGLLLLALTPSVASLLASLAPSALARATLRTFCLALPRASSLWPCSSSSAGPAPPSGATLVAAAQLLRRLFAPFFTGSFFRLMAAIVTVAPAISMLSQELPKRPEERRQAQSSGRVEEREGMNGASSSEQAGSSSGWGEEARVGSNADRARQRGEGEEGFLEEAGQVLERTTSARAAEEREEGGRPRWGCQWGSSGGSEGAGVGEERVQREEVGAVDLEKLVQRLEARETGGVGWEMIVDKASPSVDYCAWRRDPKDCEPTEYMSWTRFYGCSARDLCAFYLDCAHLTHWEPMVRSYEQLAFERGTGQETGRFVKKYPLCSPREYVLAWRVWRMSSRSSGTTYFCVTKNVEHALAPPSTSTRRVGVYHCSWRIREVQVAGAGVCAEVDMFLQEDSGMQRTVAKMAFRRSIWGYIQNTDAQLRTYPALSASDLHIPACVAQANPVPAALRHAYWSLACLSDEGSHAAQSTSIQLVSGVVSGQGAMQGAERPYSAGPAVVDALSLGRRLLHPGQRHACRNGAAAQTGLGGHIRRRALPVLAAVAGVGSILIVRGPTGLAAKVLVACAVHTLSLVVASDERSEPRSPQMRRITAQADEA